MRKVYFNKVEFDRIVDIMEKNPALALTKFYVYLKKYPLDYNAYPFCANVLISLGRAEEAEIILDEVEALANGNNKFKYTTGKYTLFICNLIYTRIKLFSYLEQYDKAFKLYMDNIIMLKNRNISLHRLGFYCRKKLGLPLKEVIPEKNNYMYLQIYDYSEERFFENMKKHQFANKGSSDQILEDTEQFQIHDDNIILLETVEQKQTSDEKDNKPIKGIFAEDFPLTSVIEEVKRKYIPSNKGLFAGFMDDTYLFRYDNCGRDGNRVSDYFKVVCFHNTSDIITMYPKNGYDNLDYVDLNYMKENEHSKRGLSMTEKFYKRYGKR